MNNLKHQFYVRDLCNICIEAYYDLIEKSEHFIYIENQFFISNPGRPDIVENRIAEKLKERIKKAHREGKHFIVIVVVPLLPGFEGDITK